MEESNEIEQARAQVRRKDREVRDEVWIRSMLKEAATGTIASAVDGQPFVHTNLFAFDESAHAIYFHTAQRGRTRSNVEADGRVCFSVHAMGRLLPADTALEMSVEYASVVVFGRAHVVDDAGEGKRGLQLLLDKYFGHLQPGRDYRPITDEELARTAVYRIEIEQWSAKRKQVGADFPGAFEYPPPLP